MTYYYKLGNIPHKRHTQFRQPDGSLYHEEVMGIHGFAGIQSILYHRRPPTRICRVDQESTVEIAYEELGPLRPRHLRSADVPAGGDAVGGAVPLMGNNDVVISVARPDKPMDYWYKFAHGDYFYFIHDGTGVLETQYGLLRYLPGDYLVLPTGVIWRVIPDDGVEQRMLVVEAYGHIEPPKRYINRYGQFLEHSPYCERDIRPPDELKTYDELGEFEVRVKARSATRWMSWAGMVICGRSLSTLRILSRLPAGSTNHRPCTRPLMGQASWSAPLCPASSTITPSPSPRRITTPMWTRTRCSTMWRVISCPARASSALPSPSTPTASPTGRTLGPMRGPLAKKGRMSWR